ncbi:uncharacterized protein LOC100845551 [Brachypodium distachyon]|uniref:DUF6817 domain-containing protein n=1 Tax=Brachypodium distachyon TaxID=15368 RepID=A0A2K2DP17_BRADI|nr:uncharacterized protein LOC100845551 [Brachypodium distachyon]PNT76016.1 hypothetical protein BRADI_1g43050v3 [Brachypodium distachyon]|eukprot:XP_024313339.1 uncharacterized protein LOC100845551 [Brachypodium distachyon]
MSMMPTNGDGISGGVISSGADALLAVARPFLRGDLGAVDPELPSLVSVLVAAGAGECYHKHGTFLAHLIDVFRILRLWAAPDAVARCGLYHSSYSNSYVNLAIFPPDISRGRVRAIVGAPAERLVHLFCVVPRHALLHQNLHLRYADAELRAHLARAVAGDDEGYFSEWRVKLRSVVPAEGVVAEHIRTGEPVALSRKVLAAFVLMTIADFSDQYTDYQDKLFGGNEDGRFEFAGDDWAALWPGTGKPGLWMSAMSRLATLYRLIATDEALRLREEDMGRPVNDEDAGLELVIPPVFDHCSKVLDPGEQVTARDLYWEAICSDEDMAKKKNTVVVEELLRRSIEKNPYVGEPWLVLAQVLLNAGRYEEAEEEAEQGLKLVLEWGSSWDKRMTWEGWVSWGRVMRDRARDRDWPRSAWGIINLGLVK